MYIGKNIQYLRRMNNSMTQESLAEKLNVSRQSVSKWESGESMPDLEKLIALCGLFSCKLDELVREDLSDRNNIYSPVAIRSLPGFAMARYVMISPNPEDDVRAYMRQWGLKSGLLTVHPDAMMIGWDFPFVSTEQQTRFNLHGYCAAYILPDGFSSDCPGTETAYQPAGRYAVCTITEPFVAPFERIPGAYRRLMDYFSENSITPPGDKNAIECFEHEYIRNGAVYMDIYMLIQD